MTDSATPPPGTDPRYKYADLRPTAITSAQLDQMMAFVMDSGGGVVGAVIGGVKIAVVMAYMIARDRLQAAEADYKKQLYEREKASDNQGQVDDDDMDAIKKGK